MNHTLDQITDLRLNGLKQALMEQLEQPGPYQNLSFEERLAHLIDREVMERKHRKTKRMLRASKLKYKSVFPEDMEYRASRNLERPLFNTLLQNHWLTEHQNVIITGPTGTGKTFLSCVLGNQAIVSGYSVYYTRIAPLMNEVALAKAEGTYLKWIKKMTRFQILILDDLGMSALTTPQAQDLLEIIEERSTISSQIITSQLPVKEWYSYFKNPTLADAIMDRLIHNAYRINLKGESMRKIKNSVSRSDTLE